MKKFFGLLTLLLTFIFSNQSLADKNNCCGDGGIIYGDKWAFLVSAPNGWNMSTTSNLGVNVAFFQKEFDKNAGNTPAFMYVTVTKKLKRCQTFQDILQMTKNTLEKSLTILKLTNP